jgi:hypothetical protein
MGSFNERKDHVVEGVVCLTKLTNRLRYGIAGHEVSLDNSMVVAPDAVSQRVIPTSETTIVRVPRHTLSISVESSSARQSAVPPESHHHLRRNDPTEFLFLTNAFPPSVLLTTQSRLRSFPGEPHHLAKPHLFRYPPPPGSRQGSQVSSSFLTVGALSPLASARSSPTTFQATWTAPATAPSNNLSPKHTYDFPEGDHGPIPVTSSAAPKRAPTSPKQRLIHPPEASTSNSIKILERRTIGREIPIPFVARRRIGVDGGLPQLRSVQETNSIPLDTVAENFGHSIRRDVLTMSWVWVDAFKSQEQGSSLRLTCGTIAKSTLTREMEIVCTNLSVSDDPTTRCG